MPRLTVCSERGCPELVPVGVSRCHEHARPAWIVPSQHTLDRPRDWYKRRERIKRRDKGTCVQCGGTGTHVDHIIPVSRGGSWSLENLQLLCVPCHSKKTKQERRAG